MPVPKGTRYRFKTLPNGKKVRLAFHPKTNKVIEAKPYSEIFGKKKNDKHKKKT